jgi:hypothetical protein
VLRVRKFRTSASAVRIASCLGSNSHGPTAACSLRLSSFFIRGIPPTLQRDPATVTVIEFQNAYFTMAASKRITRRVFSTSPSSHRRKPRRVVHKNDRIRSYASSPTPSVRHNTSHLPPAFMLTLSSLCVTGLMRTPSRKNYGSWSGAYLYTAALCVVSLELEFESAGNATAISCRRLPPSYLSRGLPKIPWMLSKTSSCQFLRRYLR